MKKRIVSAVLAGTMAASLLPPALAADAGLSNFQRTQTYKAGRFTDVASSAWYAEKVKAAYELDLIKGNSATTFNPTGNLTIAEALVLACKLNSIYYANDADFTLGTPWYQVYVDYAVENGIIKAGDYSNYNAAATRAQFALILSAALPDEALPAVNNVTKIPDVTSGTSSWANAVYRLYNAGIISGRDQYGTFAPTDSIQRSEVATIVTLMAGQSMRRTFTLQEKPAEPPKPSSTGYYASHPSVPDFGTVAGISPDKVEEKGGVTKYYYSIQKFKPSKITEYGNKITASGWSWFNKYKNSGDDSSTTVYQKGKQGMSIVLKQGYFVVSMWTSTI